MRKNVIRMLAAVAAMAMASPVPAQMRPSEPVDTAALSPEQAEIYALEIQWGEAFLEGDHAYIDNLVAPEFRLIIHEGAPIVVPREPWMANMRRWDFTAFDVEIYDIIVTGDTAVVVLSGRWQVAFEGERIIDSEFFLTDTFVRRGETWQVIRRHSQTTADRMADELSEG